MRLPPCASLLALLLAGFSACGGESSQSRAEGDPEPTACAQPYECVVTAARCCGASNPPTLADLTAVNSGKLEDFTASCQLVDCVSTLDPIPAHFGATCSAGRCVAFDVRSEQYSSCSSTDECVLRNGLGCCEGCSSQSEDFVALRADAGLTELVCGSAPVGCPACATFAEGFSAACLAGHCEVLLQPR